MYASLTNACEQAESFARAAGVVAEATTTNGNGNKITRAGTVGVLARARVQRLASTGDAEDVASTFSPRGIDIGADVLAATNEPTPLERVTELNDKSVSAIKSHLWQTTRVGIGAIARAASVALVR